VTLSRCEICGRPRDEHNRDVRFKLPDPLLKLSAEELRSKIWGNDYLLQVQGIGAFVRALLPVHLAGGQMLTFGLWLGVRPEELKTLWEIWESPEYLGHEFQGWCANAVPPWKQAVLAAPVIARPRKQDELPWVVSSSSELMQAILEREWPHEEILPGLP
jgi:hypothetical protein